MFLSCSDHGLIVGNYIADFIKNKELDLFEENIIMGIYLHRHIDTFTDNHPVFRECTHALHHTQHKYAPVVIDIYFDYFLCRHWDKFDSRPLNDFTEGIYTILEKYIHLYPEKVKQLLPRMIGDDFLLSCSTEERLIRTFSFIKRRTGYTNNLEKAHEDLKNNYSFFETQFMLFFPELISFVKVETGCA